MESFWTPLPPGIQYSDRFHSNASVEDAKLEEDFHSLVGRVASIHGIGKHATWFTNFICALYKDQLPENFAERIARIAIYEFTREDPLIREHISVLKRQGYSVSEIARRYGMARSTVYHHLRINEEIGLRCTLSRGELNDVRCFMRAYSDFCTKMGYPFTHHKAKNAYT